MNWDEVDDDSANNENNTLAMKRRAREQRKPKAKKGWWSMVCFCCFGYFLINTLFKFYSNQFFVFITISNT